MQPIYSLAAKLNEAHFTTESIQSLKKKKKTPVKKYIYKLAVRNTLPVPGGP